MTWYPHVTVAAIAERAGRFLCVEETILGKRVINQPAGHLEAGESFIEAVRRETLEETAWEFEPEYITGIYRWAAPNNGPTFIRVAFYGRLGHQQTTRSLDPDIDAVAWLSEHDLRSRHAQLRSPLVIRCLEDYLRGCRYPLALLTDLG
ncbi:NUDIX hydrolase [Alkalilimnicola ehrlichii]|uniref:Phosphatase NudJ n=1 Tax=Alkalilimnicola ehrlichii TaxID=351052 RepID=A0A3E0X2B7_9GAMM|nr:NUDIX hydrolase [Alkalilimnicola ehrlichii]RFA28436.1 NUDIX hydrolase [Alkalilimnicola ehrlichii]RFA38688.1 NUDIX hydrolase [Alkalilimnicola ehrlichii]